MIEINIPLSPLSWEAPLKGKYGFYDPREKEKRVVRFFVKEQYKQDPLQVFTVLCFTFFFKIPASASATRKADMLAGKIIPTKSDCTNLQKLYEDCLKDIVIDDDRNVAKIFSEKLYAEKEGINIKIYTLEEYATKERQESEDD